MSASNWKLLIVDGPDQGKSFPVSDSQPLVIGRGTDSDTQIRDPRLSRVHCELRIDAGHPVLTDRGGAGGTIVSGRRIDAPHPLKAGAEIRAGDTTMRLEAADPLEAATWTAPAEDRAPSRDKDAVRSPRELEGEVLFRFRLDRLVATGKSSFMFKAYDLKRERVVAVKVLKPQMASTDTQRDRFIRAMRTVLPIQHPNIVRTRKAGRSGPYCWAAFDWVDGISAAELIEQLGISGMLDWKDVWRVAVHIGRALQEASRHRIVHRNVTPSNLLRRGHDHAFLLTDLILAKALDETDAPQLTRPGDVIGELAYLAPERLFDAALADERVDQYGLGATLYALLTGQPPYSALGVGDMIEAVRTSEPKHPSEFQMGLDERFCDVVMRMLRKDPDRRFPSPTSLLRELQHVGNLGGVEADWGPWQG